MLSTDEQQRYQRQLILPQWGMQAQKRLKAARVLCVGAGGLGCPFCLYLVAAGVGCLGLIDGDCVSLNNLQRQILYRSTDCGQLKVSVAAAQLRALNPYVQIVEYPEDLTEHNAYQIMQNYDVIADCSDNFATHYLINDMCCTLQLPNVAAAVQQNSGYCAVFPGAHQGPCYRCVFPFIDDSVLIPNCTQAGILGVVPGLLGTLQANEVINSIAQQQWTPSRLIHWNAQTNHSHRMQLQADPVCRICCYHDDFKQLSRPVRLIGSAEDACCDAAPVFWTTELLDYHLNVKKEAITVLDVRTNAEFQRGHHPLAYHLPVNEIMDRLSELNQQHTLVCYCHSGLRAKQAYNLLRAAGWQRVFCLDRFNGSDTI